MSESRDFNADADAPGYLTVEVGEFKNKRSLKRVHDIYDMVDQAFVDTYEMYAMGEIRQQGRDIRLLKAVQRYIRTVYPLLMDYSMDLEEAYADEHDDVDIKDLNANSVFDAQGNVTKPINRYWCGYPDTGEDPIGWVEKQAEEPVVFWGLRDIREAEDMYTEAWEEVESNPHVPDSVEPRTEKYTVPAWVSEEAFDQVTLFLTEERDVIGLDFADEDHQTHIDEELLREVDEWRQNNVN